MLVPFMVETIPTENESEQFMKSMIAMVALGFGEIIGANLQGRVIDRIGFKPTCIINMILVLLATMFVLNFIYIGRFTYFAFVMTFMWGL